MDELRLLVVGLLALGVGLWAALAPVPPSIGGEGFLATTGAVVGLAPAASTDTYFRFSADSYAEPGQRVFIASTEASGGTGQNETVTAWLLNATNGFTAANSTASSNGAANFSLTLPAVEGNWTLVVNSSNHTNKSFALVSDWFQKAALGFLDRQPPFLPGDSFRINTSAQFSNGTPLAAHNVRIRVYAANGQLQSWGADKDNTTDSNGVTTHAFTIPSSAGSGDYIAQARGGYAVFTIKNYTVAVNTLATNGDVKTFFAATDTVVVQAKVTSNGTAVSAGSVTATVATPNGAAAGSLTLSGSSGVYNASFTNLTAGEGAYTITVNATVGGASTTAIGTFQVRSVRLSVSESSFGGFFDEWGSKKAVAPGNNISLDIKAFDVATGSFIKGSANPGAERAMNCSNIGLISLKHSNGTDYTGLVAIQNRVASQKFFGDAMCTVVVNTTALAGVYAIKLNVSVNASTAYAWQNATGFFSTGSYLLKVSSIGKIGKEGGFALAKPGTNATFKIEARNVSSGRTLGKGNISGVTVTSITPIGEFGAAGGSAVTSVSSWFDSTKDKLTVTVPTSVGGPALVAVMGTVAGESVSGSGFFVANYLMGFAGPVGGGSLGGGLEGGETGGGPGGEFGGTIASCTAAKPQAFFGFVMDAETAQPKSSATLSLSSVQEMRTGSNMTSCFSTPGGITDSTGRAQFNVSVTNSSCANLLSGDYFMVFEATWQNLTDRIPGGFTCKRLNFWPYSSTWMLGKNGSVNLTLSNIGYTENTSKRVTNGTANITRLVNFDPGKGATIIAVDRFAGINLMGATNYMSFSPINFSTFDSNNVSWLSGFYDATVRVCDNNNTASAADDTCDTAFTGWSVQPFQAFINDPTVWSRNWSLNQTVGVRAWSERNVTSANITRVNFRSQERTTIANLVCIDNSGVNCWTRNNTGPGFPQGGFLVTLNFTVNQSLETGPGMFEIKLNDNLTGDSVTTDVFADIKGVLTQVVVMPEIWPQEPRWGGLSFFPFSMGGTTPALNTTLNTSANLYLNWNLTYLLQAFNAASKFVAQPGATGYCLFTNILNNSADGSSMMIAFANDTPSSTGDTLFFKNTTLHTNASNTLGPVKVGGNLSMFGPGFNKIYLKKFEFCIPVFVSANSSEYTAGCGQPGTAPKRVCDTSAWQTQWAFAGRFQTNQNATIPFFVGSGSTGQAGVVVNITDIAEMTKDKIGFSAVLPASSGRFKAWAANTDSNGAAFVTLNVTQAGTYKLFWNAVISGTEEVADFMNAPVIEVSSFQAWGEWNDTGMSTRTATTNYQNFTAKVNVMYFNGTNIPGANVSLRMMDFSSFGPPVSTALVVSNATGGARTTQFTTDSNGQFVANITAPSGWPTGRWGTCTNIEGTVNASTADASLGTSDIFLGNVCTLPTG